MSSKNKKSLLRKIVVNNEKYYWIVCDYNCDGDGSCRFKIYKDKKVIYEDLICNEIITPKIVREKILEL